MDYMIGIRFFEPDTEMLQWLREYIGKRIPVDVGCGEGDLLIELGKGGVGIDPFTDIDPIERMQMLHKHNIHFIPQKIEESERFIKGLGKKAIMIFARPCHSNFVEAGIDLAPKGMEILYITKLSNVEDYNDLGIYSNRKKLIAHRGAGKENEVVYSIVK